MREAGDGNILNNFRYGTPANVWHLGLLMWRMLHCTEWCEDGNPEKLYKYMGDVAWPDDNLYRPGRPERFVLQLYPTSKTWLNIYAAQSGQVHTLAIKDDIDFYSGMWDDVPPDTEPDPNISEEERLMNVQKREVENRARKEFRENRLYSDVLNKLIMDCLIVQQEARIDIQEIYKVTEIIKSIESERRPPYSQPPYYPQPPLGDLPPPWNDTTKVPGAGLGVPVPETYQSRELFIDELFYAHEEHEHARLVRLWARHNPIDNVPEIDDREAISLINRNKNHYTQFIVGVRQFGGQRTRPVYQIPAAFPQGFEYGDTIPPGDGGGGGGDGGGGAGGGGARRPSHDLGNPKGPSDFSFEATPPYLKTFLSSASTAPPQPGSGIIPPPVGYGGGDLGGFVPVDIELPKYQKEDTPDSQRGKEPGKRPGTLWLEFPFGLQKSVDKSLIERALRDPELKDTLLFCTVIDRSGDQDTLKGVIYLLGLTPKTTILQIKKILTEEMTGIPVRNMKLMGNDQFIFREFEDDEERAVIRKMEIFVFDITKG
ncbi:hypothetical protein NHQ30_006439 [Ciborinia camelliae]|nr:hypothetical protein NHQ30_006439 [Ciborinia camelliae]